MRTVRIRTFDENDKFYSYYFLFSEKKEILKFRDKNNGLTYAPITKFKIQSLCYDRDRVRIALLDKDDNEVKVLKFEFKDRVYKKDPNTGEEIYEPKFTVSFETDTPGVFPDNKIDFVFSDDFMGYRSGAFYRLFAALVKTGYFCHIDGSMYTSENCPAYTDDHVRFVDEYKAKLTAEKKQHFAAKDKKIDEDLEEESVENLTDCE